MEKESAGSAARFIVDGNGERTHVILPIAVYESLMALKEALKGSGGTGENSLFYLKKGALTATGYPDGLKTRPCFVLAKDSEISLAAAPSLYANVAAKRADLISSGVLILNSAHTCYNLTSDIKLPSPSFAAALVVGQVVNGLKLWKNREGFSLKDLGFGTGRGR